MPTLNEAAEVLRLRAALNRIMTGGNSLASVLVGVFDAKIPPYETDFETVRNKIKDQDVYDLWLCWSVMMRERDALAADPGPLVAAVEGLVGALEKIISNRVEDEGGTCVIEDECSQCISRAALAAYRAALGGDAARAGGTR